MYSKGKEWKTKSVDGSQEERTEEIAFINCGDAESLFSPCLVVTGKWQSSEHSSGLLSNKHICMYMCFTWGKLMGLLMKAFKLSG